MSLAASAFVTSRGVMDGALEQRTSQDANRRGESGCELFTLANGLLSCHR
jgi:hypothetical protein